MIRKAFVETVRDTGMITLQSLRPLLIDRDKTSITEFKLLSLPNFNEEKFARESAKAKNLEFVNLVNKDVPKEITRLLKKRFIMKYRVIPIKKDGQHIVLATFDATIIEKLDDLKRIFKRQVKLVVTTISRWKEVFDGVEETVEELAETVVEVDPDVVKRIEVSQLVRQEDIKEDTISFVNRILAEAYSHKASDIHLEPYENCFRVRLRVDGELIEAFRPSLKSMPPVISRLKIMAKMDIAERRKPQDGRIKIFIAGKPIDYRVSSLPTLFGEKIVLRVLDSNSLELDMTKLGFEKNQLKKFKEGISRPNGMCLVTGPTGSGKTTSLYSALSELNKVQSNISTIENPVEFNLEGINQVNVRADIGLTFASALRTFLRQDPDIVMVGEIRDKETAKIAVEAALTGHLVLSTLHTNDAPSTITRLLNMGVEPFLLVGSLNTIVAQRLCRKICLHCRHQINVSIEKLMSYGYSKESAERVKVYHGQGCLECNHSGYRGRVAIYEVLSVSSRIKEMILQGASTAEIKKQGLKEGMKTLRMSALTKVAAGVTTLEEALIITAAD